MANTPQSVNGNDVSEKETLPTALREDSKARSSLDGVADDDADGDIYSRANPQRPGFTKNDQKDMYRMGRTQKFRRSYRPFSTLSFTVVLTSVWEFLLIANTQGLTDGGLAGLFWSCVWTFIGFGFVIASLAEMASMAPISSAQYHWVSEFAPPKYQHFLSYITGWMSTLSWQAGNASGSFLTGTITQALLVVNYPDYVQQSWQGTLLVFAMALIVFVVNIWGAQLWPKIQNGLFTIHMIGFLVVIIVLWVLAPHQSATAVFTDFESEGGWSSIGLSLMCGQITAIYGLLGCEGTAHMAEEVGDAGRYVPMSIFWSYIGNGIMAIIFLTTYLFSIDSVDDALADPSGFPFIHVFGTAVSTVGVNGLTSMIIIIVVASNISWGASTARQTYAFARDKGLPFSDWIGQVHPKLEVPANAIALTSLFTCLISLINIGSNVAFNAIISLEVVAIMMTYSVSISCVLYCRLTRPDHIPVARWSLGKWGVPINIIGLAYVVFTFFWSFWPGAVPVTAENMNWSVVLFVGVLFLSLVWYAFRGRMAYVGPVAHVRAERISY